MKKLNYDLCKQCGECIEVCTLEAITKDEEKYPVFLEHCVDCDACLRFCPQEAIQQSEVEIQNFVECNHCRVLCKIQDGFCGACKRYRNTGGTLVRDIPLHQYKYEKTEADSLDLNTKKAIDKPLISAIGAGTNFPCFLPAPYIVQDEVEGVDVVTAVSEVPLSYSGIRVKIDTGINIGSPGLKIKRKGKEIGLIIAEEYGSIILSIGGINQIAGKNGFMATKTIVDIANGEFVELKVEKGPKLGLQVGRPPVIDGVEDKKVKCGCGGAILSYFGLFGEQLKDVADEVISADLDIIGLMSAHMIGKKLGFKYCGVKPIGKMSTPGNYFVEEQGDGWGGTTAATPQELIREINMDIAWPGMTIFIVETTGKRAALLRMDENGQLEELPLTKKAEEVRQAVYDLSQDANVSALYVGGIGGGARAGVSQAPLEVNYAVKNGLMKVTVAGAPTYIFPGGNIIIAAEIGKVSGKSFHLTPTPAPIVPVEYTTTLDIYKRIKGHTSEIVNLSELKEKNKIEFKHI